MALLTKRNQEMPPEAEIPVIDPMLAINVYADLLPREILEARQGRRQRNLIIAGLILLVVTIMSWWGASAYLTSKAQDDLDASNAQTTALLAQQRSFNRLSDAKAQSARISGQLKALTAQDLQWADMVRAIRNAAPAGLIVTTIDGKVDTQGAASKTQPLPGASPIGTLSVDGVASARELIAQFIDNVSHITGLAGLNPATTTSSTSGVQFTASFILTSALYKGRYSSPTPAGGK
jgi:hypothetical protein